MNYPIFVLGKTLSSRTKTKNEEAEEVGVLEGKIVPSEQMLARHIIHLVNRQFESACSDCLVASAASTTAASTTTARAAGAAGTA
jgi:hypothetical protein